MSERKGPESSATLYKVGTKKTGNDGNTWIIQENKNGVKRWVLYKIKSSKKSSKKPSKKPSKKSSKKPSKKSSKKSSKKTSKQIIIKTENNYIFDSFDIMVFDKIMEYKPIYELIMRKSIEYIIDIPKEIFDNFLSSKYVYNVNIENKNDINDNYTAELEPLGMIYENTFIWNNETRLYFGENIITGIIKHVQNNLVINTIKKLFNNNRIEFPKKYVNIIPYICSLFVNPEYSNIVRFINRDGYHIFFDITQQLDVPYFIESTNYILNDLHNMKENRGSNNSEILVRKKNKSTRMIKEDILFHKTNIDSTITI
jgi:hypothetical protein